MSSIFLPVFLVATVSAAPSSVDIPNQLPNRGVTERHQVIFKVSETELKSLMLTHKKKCTEFGRSNCQVYEIGSPNDSYENSGLLKLRFAPNVAETFIADVFARASLGSVSRSDQGNRNDSGHDPKELQLQKTLLQAQREKLRLMENSADADSRRFIASKLVDVDSQIRRIDEQLVKKANEFGVEEVTMIYSHRDGVGYDHRRRSDLNKVFDMLLYGLIGSVGIALITVLYLGTIGFSFLGLRKLAIKVGLLKSGIKISSTNVRSNSNTPDPSAA